MREDMSKAEEKNDYQKTVISDLKSDLKTAINKNVKLTNSISRLNKKKAEISEEVETLRKKEAMLVKLENKLTKDIEKARLAVIKEQEKRARLQDRLLKIRKAAHLLYGITK